MRLRKKKPDMDRFELERKRAEQEQAGLEEMWKRQVKRGVIV